MPAPEGSQRLDAAAIPTATELQLSKLRQENENLRIHLASALQRIAKLQAELDASRAQVAWFTRQLFGQKKERVDSDAIQRAFLAYCAEQDAASTGDVHPPTSGDTTPASTTQLLLAEMLAALPQGDSKAESAETTAVEGPAPSDPVAATSEVQPAPEAEPPPPSVPCPESKSEGHGRRAIPDSLPTTYYVIEPENVPEGAREAPPKVTVRLGMVRPSLVRIVIVRQSYAVDKEDGTTKLVTAEPPSEMIPRGLLAPSGLAHVIAAKYAYHEPWHQLAVRFGTGDYRPSDSTFSGAAIRAVPLAMDLVKAIEAEAKADAPSVHIDPTSMRLLRKLECHRGSMWVRYAPGIAVLCSFSMDQTSKQAEELLAGWGCPVVCDGAQIFDQAVKRHRLERGGCWSHARRKLVYVAPMDGRALVGLKWIQEIFAIERSLAELEPEARLAERLRRAKPLVDALFEWRDKLLADPTLAARGELAKALRYLRNQEERLTLFLRDGRVAIHNNFAELGARHVVVGRKRWLFLGSEDAARAASAWYTLVLSARMHQLDPEDYLRDLFRVLPIWPRHRILELAPHLWSLTRSRLNPDELAREYGPIRIPPAQASEPGDPQKAEHEAARQAG